MRWQRLLLVVVVLPLGMLAASAAAPPALVVISPTVGDVVVGPEVTVSFQVDEFAIVPSSVSLAEAGRRPEANRAGEGHLHLMLDLEQVAMHYAPPPFTFRNVPPGEHRLTVELVNNDHSPLSPPVVRQVRFRSGVAELPKTGTADHGVETLAFLVLGGLTLASGGLLLRSRRS